jgi:hypothetical protein
MTKITLLTALVLLSCACSPYKVQQRNEPNVEIPTSFGVTTPGVKVPEHWWLAFQDKGLNEVVLQAFQDNLDLKQAWARLDQAQALVTIESAARFPEVNLDASANRSKQVITDGNSIYSNRFKLGLGLTWEIDLWKKIANRAEAAVLLASASRADAEQTALLLSGTVVDLWFTIQEQEHNWNSPNCAMAVAWVTPWKSCNRDCNWLKWKRKYLQSAPFFSPHGTNSRLSLVAHRRKNWKDNQIRCFQNCPSFQIFQPHEFS